MSEIVYLLTNPAMPGLVKIGKTTQEDPQLRMDDLYSTGVPLPFDCELAMEVDDAAKVESILHETFESHRVNPRREFFEMDALNAASILRQHGIRDVTLDITKQTDGEDSVSKAASAIYKKKHPKLDFEKMGISTGSVLHFTLKNAQVTVVDARKVRFEGQKPKSLNAVTQELTENEDTAYFASYWRFDGRLVSDIYEETCLSVD